MGVTCFISEPRELGHGLLAALLGGLSPHRAGPVQVAVLFGMPTEVDQRVSVAGIPGLVHQVSAVSGALSSLANSPNFTMAEVSPASAA